MNAMQQGKQQPRTEPTGMERLSLRFSEMINHPIAQLQRWVTIHRLDADGEREWEEVLGVIAATDELDLKFNHDGSVTVRWEGREREGKPGIDEWEVDEKVVPF